ncbi:vomeronasal type-1 receptor 4-like [Macrotis lagotis]|uniref:vomeronasal type-1 receptor 4-like n=1 Tax=Macrotis lagotis TaxID=92651 RepID=UPI003D69F0DD
MLTLDKFLGIVYLLLTVAGFLGNFFLLLLSSIQFLIAHRTRPKNLIILNLAFSNVMVLVFRGIPTTTRLWRVKCSLDKTGIKIITYMQILTRTLSLCSTCLLSVFQAITISPSNSIWAQFKMRARKDILLLFLCLWLFSLLFNIILFMYYAGTKNITDSKFGCSAGYRLLDVFNNKHAEFIIIIDVHHILFMFLMIFSSVYMVSILYQHKKHVNHIQRNSLSTKISPETRATQAIMLIVYIFVLFNIFSPIFDLCMFYFKYTYTWMIHSSTLLSLWYPTVNSLILICTDKQIPRTSAH